MLSTERSGLSVGLSSQSSGPWSPQPNARLTYFAITLHRMVQHLQMPEEGGLRGADDTLSHQGRGTKQSLSDAPTALS